jgi:sirohydrochlorin cobaltochelatase
VGHGSSQSADSAAPIYRHARLLEQCGEFDVVRVAFWKEEPYLHTAFSGLQAMPVTVVPVFMAHGYFAGRVVPRELGVAERPATSYLDAVGTSVGIVDVVRDALEEVAVPDLHVLLIGHGTPRSSASRSTAEATAQSLEQFDRYASVGCAFIDDEPRVDSALDDLPTAATVAIVPFFVADGPHTRLDLARMLRLSDNPAFGRHTCGGRQLVLLPAIGESPAFSDLVVRIARENEAPESPRWRRENTAAADRLADMFACARRLGEVAVAPTAGGWTLRHADGGGTPERLSSPLDLHEMARTGKDGTHRLLRSLLGLCNGWRYEAASPAELVEALESLYPGTVDTLLSPSTFVQSTTETLEQQSGRYARIERATVTAQRSQLCETRCLRHPIWGAAAGDIDSHLRCPRPCNALLDTCLGT